ncbi:M20 family metallo-hydrolase [Oceanobacillus halophilus]|uniref:M20 family metallo-hydrolase n=1 Tax=Oceanobacillus halophilus TaxID=930130 RepID=UPI001F4D48BA|nr:M20 family metallo-hydrolase [Oceanobacillus halophilus]
MKISRVMETLQVINQMGETNHGIERLAYTLEEQQAKQYILKECKKLGMETSVDAAGNVIAKLPGTDPYLPAVAIGSHLDTVYSGGRYDGALGVVAGLEIVRTMVEEGIETAHSVELIAFACEESSRFNFATLGSKAMTGKVDQETLEELQDKDGISLRNAVVNQGLELDQFLSANRKNTPLKAFYELHIEQGLKLIDEKKSVGIVTGVAAPLRLAIEIEGRSSHSGTTGMTQRKDALLSASELSLAVEKAALLEEDFGTVATVGVLELAPGAMNVVPGYASLKVDIRSTNVESRNRVLNRIKERAELLEEKRGTTISMKVIQEDQPVIMDEKGRKSLAKTCEDVGVSYLFMASGAGHDAMNMATCWPSALIFVPSVDGLSHHPDEFTEEKDIETGLKVLEAEVLKQAVIVSKGEDQHASTGI